MTVHIQPLLDSQYEAAVALYNLIYSERVVQPDTWRREDQARSAAAAHERWVVVEDDGEQVVGYGVFWRVREREIPVVICWYTPAPANKASVASCSKRWCSVCDLLARQQFKHARGKTTGKRSRYCNTTASAKRNACMNCA